MPLSSSPIAYEDVRKLLDSALESDKGLRIKFLPPGRAINMAQRCNKFRSDDRKRMLLVYDEGDPRRGTSIYDTLTIQKELPPGKPDKWAATQPGYVVIRKHEGMEFDVEEL